MTSRNKKYLGNKTASPVSVVAAEPDRDRPDQSAVVIELVAGHAKQPARDVSSAAEGLRLMQAFLKIPDPAQRAALIRMAEDYVRRTR